MDTNNGKPGDHYRSCVAEIGDYAPMLTLAPLYLYDQEIRSWMTLCRMANMTTYKDGEFDMKLDRLMKETESCQRKIVAILQNLCKIGYLRRHKIGRSYRYRFDFHSMKIMSDIIALNPGIGLQLRGIRGDNPVISTKNSEVKKACERAGDEFVYCDFLDE